jgi:hypothetical protein
VKVIPARNAIPRRAAFAATLATAALLAGTGLAGPALAAPARPDGSWGTQASVPTITSALAPTVATSGSTLYVGYATSTGGIDYTIHTTYWWPKIRTVSGTGVDPDTTVAPALAYYDGNLWAFWINSSDQIRYTRDVSGTWQPTQTVKGTWGTALSSTTPALTVASGELWLVWKNQSSDDIDYSDTAGTSWFMQQTAVSDATGDAPAVAPTGLSAAPLVIAWTESNNSVGYGILSFLGFENLGTVPQVGTNAAPALNLMTATTGGTLYLAWKGANTNKVFFDQVNDLADSSLSPSSWSPQATLPDALTSTTPALGVNGTTLDAIYKGRTSDTVYYETATEPQS